jgi:hypothetical protein
MTITMPDEQASRVTHALCQEWGLEETGANAKQAVISYMKEIVRKVEHADDIAAAQADWQAAHPQPVDVDLT